MKEKLLQAWLTLQEKAYENRNTLIQVGGILVGAAIGAAVATAIANAQNDILLEEILSESVDPTVE